MHSSRMRTGRLLPVSPSMHCSGGGCVSAREVYLPKGGVPARGCTCPVECTCLGVYLPRGCTCQGGVPARGCTCWGYLPGGCTCQRGGVPARESVYLPRGVPVQVLAPSVNRMTDRCKNITLPQTSFFSL